MAKNTAKVTNEVIDEHPDWVEVRAPRGADTYISVNLHSFVLPAGKVSRVPKYIADEFYRSQEAIARFDEEAETLKLRENV